MGNHKATTPQQTNKKRQKKATYFLTFYFPIRNDQKNFIPPLNAQILYIFLYLNIFKKNES